MRWNLAASSGWSLATVFRDLLSRSLSSGPCMLNALTTLLTRALSPEGSTAAENLSMLSCMWSCSSVAGKVAAGLGEERKGTSNT